MLEVKAYCLFKKLKHRIQSKNPQKHKEEKRFFETFIICIPICAIVLSKDERSATQPVMPQPPKDGEQKRTNF